LQIKIAAEVCKAIVIGKIKCMYPSEWLEKSSCILTYPKASLSLDYRKNNDFALLPDPLGTKEID